MIELLGSTQMFCLGGTYCRGLLSVLPVVPSLSAFILRIQKLPRLLVASSDGHLYIYNVDPQDGGECVLVQKHK